MRRLLRIGLVLSLGVMGHAAGAAEPSGDPAVIRNMAGLVAFWAFGEEAGQPRW